ncbi:hypothetical protein IFM12275_03490 [Nocardia sputorum]|uniref:hypothetical protein n=1 Tax=Nocardia TaxID=1817 RepID=UPI002491712E|nr:hypothetical protein [Nocardia sputorum]BDT90373.1 hypothetical protein IFM12275_03490 [Nocardia sputorum]
MSRTASRSAQLADERRRIRDAAQRLLTGAPHRSSGTLTISTLATEAALSRQRLYEHHPDLVAEFKAETGSAPASANAIAVQQQLADAHDRIRELEGRERERLDQIKPSARSSPNSPTKPAASNLVLLTPRRADSSGSTHILR